MESLSKEKNLILGLLLGVALAVAIPYAQPSELRASEEVVPAQQASFNRVIQRVLYCIDGSVLSGALGGTFGDSNQITLRLSTYCDR